MALMSPPKRGLTSFRQDSTGEEGARSNRGGADKRHWLPDGMVSRNLKAMEFHFKGEFIEEAEMDARLKQMLRA